MSDARDTRQAADAAVREMLRSLAEHMDGHDVDEAKITRLFVGELVDLDAALAARVLSAAGGLRAGLAAEGPLPSRGDIRGLVEELVEVLFPESHRLGTDGPSGVRRAGLGRAREADG